MVSSQISSKRRVVVYPEHFVIFEFIIQPRIRFSSSPSKSIYLGLSESPNRACASRNEQDGLHSHSCFPEAPRGRTQNSLQESLRLPEQKHSGPFLCPLEWSSWEFPISDQKYPSLFSEVSLCSLTELNLTVPHCPFQWRLFIFSPPS